MEKFSKVHSFVKSTGRKLFLLFVGACIVFSLAGCFLLPEEEVVLAPPLKEPPKVTYKIYEVKKGNIEKSVLCRGTFVSIEQSDLGFKDQSGRLKRIYVNLGDAVKKGQLLAELDTENTESRLKEQEIIYEKAKLAYEKAEISGQSQYDLKQASLDVELQRLKLEELKTGLQKARLVAPADGVVVYKHIIKEGENVPAYQTLIRISDPTRLQLQFSEDEYSKDKVYAFQLGMEVDVKIKDEHYVGEVVMTPYDMPADADSSMKKAVRIRVPNLPEGIKIGDGADIKLLLEKKDNIIILPKNLINTEVSRKYVQVLEDGIRKEKDIEIGIQTDTEVEIVKGLEEGENVIER